MLFFVLCVSLGPGICVKYRGFEAYFMLLLSFDSLTGTRNDLLCVEWGCKPTYIVRKLEPRPFGDGRPCFTLLSAKRAGVPAGGRG